MSTSSVSRRMQAVKTALFIGLLALSVFATMAWAESLQALRASGALGESYTGYVVARQPSAKAVADATNEKRKAVYAEKAKVQGVSIDQVGKVYAQEIIKTLPKGTWIQNASGQWLEK